MAGDKKGYESCGFVVLSVIEGCSHGIMSDLANQLGLSNRFEDNPEFTYQKTKKRKPKGLGKSRRGWSRNRIAFQQKMGAYHLSSQSK